MFTCVCTYVFTCEHLLWQLHMSSFWLKDGHPKYLSRGLARPRLLRLGKINSDILFLFLFVFCFVCLFCFICLFQGRVSRYSHGCPGVCSADQAGQELTEIHLPVPPKCGIKGMSCHCLVFRLFVFVFWFLVLSFFSFFFPLFLKQTSFETFLLLISILGLWVFQIFAILRSEVFSMLFLCCNLLLVDIEGINTAFRCDIKQLVLETCGQLHFTGSVRFLILCWKRWYHPASSGIP